MFPFNIFLVYRATSSQQQRRICGMLFGANSDEENGEVVFVSEISDSWFVQVEAINGMTAWKAANC